MESSNHLNDMIDKIQKKELADGLFSNENLNQDILNRQIDLWQKRIENSNINEQQKINIQKDMIKYLSEISRDGNIDLNETIGFFDQIGNKSTENEKVGNDGMPYVNLSQMDDNTRESFYAELGQIFNKKGNLRRNEMYSSQNDQIHKLQDSLDILNINHLIRICEKYSSNISQGKQNDEVFNLVNYVYKQGVNQKSEKINSLLEQGVILKNSFNNENISVINKLSKYSYPDLIGKFGIELANKIQVRIDYLKIPSEYKKHYGSDYEQQEGLKDLQSNGLKLPENILLYSNSKEITKVKTEISDFIENINNDNKSESKKIQDDVRSIYIALTESLSDSGLGTKDYINVIKNFQKSIEDEVPKWNFVKSSNDIINLIGQFGKKNKIKYIGNLMDKIKAGRISFSSLMNDLNLKETALLVSTYLPFGVGNGLDLTYGIYAFNSGKSVITGNDIDKSQAVTQIGIAVSGLAVDFYSGGTAGAFAKGTLKVIFKNFVKTTEGRTFLGQLTKLLLKFKGKNNDMDFVYKQIKKFIRSPESKQAFIKLKAMA